MRVATLAALAALIAAGCGDDDHPSDGSPPQPPALVIEATGSKDRLAFTAPREVPAGVTSIELTNSSELRELDAQLLYTAEPHSDTDVSSEFAAVTVGAPVADWFEAGGGIGPTPKGETQTATQALEEGTYYVVGGDGAPRPPLTSFKVTAGEHAASLPEPQGVVTASEYAFAAKGLKAGTNQVLLENAGREWHHFLASRMVDGATIEDAEFYLRARVGQSPFVGADGADSAVLEGGASQIVELELKPGRYAFYCFMSDRGGGDPHMAKGMVSEIVVPAGQ